MRVTSSFAVFRFEPGEKVLTKARWYGREGRPAEAEREYLAALASDPDLRAGWLELFELLRVLGRHADALALARRAAAHFGPDAAMPLALTGAALCELGRTREGIAALEAALERDGNLALAWHELGYAAFKSGEFSRALLVLDRAFALEPHTDTLMLRGRILREAGQFDAAEVAFEAAHQSAEHDAPRRDAEREIAATRRAATFGGRKPRAFTVRERAFADFGTILLDGGTGSAGTAAGGLAGLLGRCLGAFVHLAGALGWEPAVCAGLAPEDRALVEGLALALRAHVVPAASLDPADRPLIVSVFGDSAEFAKQLARLDRWGAGYGFALMQTPGAAGVADVVGSFRGPPDADTAYAAALALERTVAEPDALEEITALARHPLARWRVRQSPPPDV
jgi:Tfp pilus assembly protein PilF